MKYFLSLMMLGLSFSCSYSKSDDSKANAAKRIAFPGPGDVHFNPAHFEGPFTVNGSYDFDPLAIASAYNGVKPQNFGTLILLTGPSQYLRSRATGKPKYFRELHYNLGDGQVGMKPIPIVDREGRPGEESYEVYPREGFLADKITKVVGSEELEKAIRIGYGFRGDDESVPPLAFLSYLRPQNYKISLTELANMSLLKTENSMTHLGAYIGDGMTRNSPFEYHNMKFEVKGYPTNVTLVTPNWPGADIKTYLTSARVTLRLLNELNGGPQFPPDYKFDHYRAINLYEVFSFYRAWLDPSWERRPGEGSYLEKLKNEMTHATYCSEHMTMVINASLNLPQNLFWYQKVWGDTDGSRLWDIAESRYENELIGAKESMPKIDQNKFKPLWHHLGITKPSELTKFGMSLAWSAETTSDLLSDFVEQYVSWVDVGPVLSATYILGFQSLFQTRLGLSPETYLESLIPTTIKMIKHDATTRHFKTAPNPEAAYLEYLSVIEHGAPSQGLPGLRSDIWKNLDAYQPGTLDMVISSILQPLKSAEMKKYIIDNSGRNPDSEAWPEFLNDIKSEVEVGRDFDVALAPDESGKRQVTEIAISSDLDKDLDGKVDFMISKLSGKTFWLYDKYGSAAIWLTGDNERDVPLDAKSADEHYSVDISGTSDTKEIANLIIATINNIYTEEKYRFVSNLDATAKMIGGVSRESYSIIIETQALGNFEDAKWKSSGEPRLSISVIRQGAEKYVKYYSPPAILHRVEYDIHPKSPFVNIKTIGTVMDASEVCLKKTPTQPTNYTPGSDTNPSPCR